MLFNYFVLFILHSLIANFSKKKGISVETKIKHKCCNVKKIKLKKNQKNQTTTKPINDSFFHHY